MSFRKALKYFLFAAILLSAVFWKPLLENGIGYGAKAFLHLSRGWQLEYSSVEVGKEGIAFSNFAVSQPGYFALQADGIAISLREKHFEIENPRVALEQLPSLQANGSSWTFAIRGGTLEGEGIEAARFYAERKFPGQVGRFHFDWERGAALTLEVLEEQGFLKIDLVCEEFNPFLLRKWFGNEVGGNFSGRAYLVAEGEKIVRGIMQLKGKEVAWREYAKGIWGSLDWEGPFTWDSFFETGRLKISVDQGEFGALGGMKGECSFVGQMGTKWEFTGMNLNFPVSWQGRGFFQSSKEHWVDSELFCGDASFSFSGKKNAQWHWEGTCKKVEAEHATFVQSFLSWVDPRVSEFEFSKGIFDLSGKAVGSIDQISGWELSSFSVQGFKGKGKNWSLAFERGEGIYADQGGKFSFENGVLEADWLSRPSVWSGEGILGEGKVQASHFQGKWGDFSLCVQAEGAPEEFSLQIQSRGPLEGKAACRGGWNGEKLFLALEEGEVEKLSFAGCGWVDSNFDFVAQVNQFVGPVTTLWKLAQIESSFEGLIEGVGEGFTAQGGKNGWDWLLTAHVEEGYCPLFSYAHLTGVEMEIRANPLGFACYEVKGDLVSGKQFPFYCPVVKSRGEFDLRLLGDTWDFFRLAGATTEEAIEFDLQKSRILGKPFHFAKGRLGPGGPEEGDFRFQLPWKSLAALFSSLSLPRSLALAPIDGEVGVVLHWGKEGSSQLEMRGKELLWKKQPLPFELYAFEKKGMWKIERFQWADFSLAAEVCLEQDAFQIANGRGECGEDLDFNFEGKIHFSKRMEFHLPRMKVDLELASSLKEIFDFPVQKLEGVLEGVGHVIWDGVFDADFDLTASSLHADSLFVENQGPLHISYSSDKGAFFQGLDFQIGALDSDLPSVHCKADLLQYDIAHSCWVMNRSHLHLPKDFLAKGEYLPLFLQTLQLTHDIDLIADLSSSSDFSFFECFMQEGFLPFAGELRQIQKLHFSADKNRCMGSFSYSHQDHLLKMGFKAHYNPIPNGRITFEEEGNPPAEGEIPLTVEWSADKERGILLHSIEGTFGGVDALFHAENVNSLIGSARIHFGVLSELIPPRVAEVFRDLKMGKGYELKGHLRLEPEGIFFQGLLSGKQIELFDYQLRTLLGQIEWTPQKVWIYDVKVSDSAGIMKIDEILIEQKENQPWTISMPHLTITELRPSLLQKVGEGPGNISPLVVRELKLNDFRGLLEDSHTYTAWGELFFINSYKREYTVFDVPSDVLSRIVGLDLDLLIPVRGWVRYELKDRLFRLNELKDSYSEGERSEFFLVQEGNSPTMDLDGNLQIFVTMKQFVLFKFTESFLISIDGKLDNPKFHLQRKRHFLGL